MMQRRHFLKNTMATGAVALAAASGLLVPVQVLAWNKKAFEAKDVSGAMKGSIGTELTTASDKINIKAPDIAENGAVVPVTISSTLSGVTSITLLSEKNGTPLVAKFNLKGKAEAFVSTRIKMGKTSNIIAICESAGKFYSARKEVKVTIGGCGG
ncbi:thiosulfate oxidation carrier protein SoxY [sulfur-oxidizing endosymbiont of Gigantopelta aegis]|uniref:thiosulfate oxidation carrier protein SoxY n=1 Tax=sulfur-oxidizing endosymbiont of Gigantopelta aegis TaxID=2794934 RepID=UPI0031B64C3F